MVTIPSTPTKPAISGPTDPDAMARPVRMKANSLTCPRVSPVTTATRPAALILPRRRRRALGVLVAEGDAALVEVVWRHLDGHPVTGNGADAELLHLACGVGDDLVIVLQLHPEARVWQHLGYDAFELEHFFFRHKNFPCRLLEGR